MVPLQYTDLLQRSQSGGQLQLTLLQRAPFPFSKTFAMIWKASFCCKLTKPMAILAGSFLSRVRPHNITSVLGLSLVSKLTRGKTALQSECVLFKLSAISLASYWNQLISASQLLQHSRQTWGKRFKLFALAYCTGAPREQTHYVKNKGKWFKYHTQCKQLNKRN